MGIKKELGKKIKRMRLAKGYTQDKLSEIVDISQKALCSIEVGENSEKLELVYNLTKSLTRIQLKASQQGNYVAKSIENSYNIPKREVLLQKAQIYVKIFPIRKLNEY